MQLHLTQAMTSREYDSVSRYRSRVVAIRGSMYEAKATLSKGSAFEVSWGRFLTHSTMQTTHSGGPTRANSWYRAHAKVAERVSGYKGIWA